MDNHEMKIRKGQAFNLAVNDAVSLGKQDDVKYIYSRFVKYFELGDLLQNASIEDIKKAMTGSE